MKTEKVVNQKLGNFGNFGNTIPSFLVSEFSIDRYITALKQLLLLTQKHGTLYLIAAKIQPH